MKSIESIVGHALDVFWTAVAKNFPENVTGDLEPGLADALEEAATDAVRAWVMNNAPRRTVTVTATFQHTVAVEYADAADITEADALDEVRSMLAGREVSSDEFTITSEVRNG